MAETHILQHITAFALALWWTKSWLMDSIVARWRFAVSALASSILWIYVAFTATRVFDISGGTETVFSSIALSYFAAFMAFVSVVGAVLGLFLWTEESAKEAAGQEEEVAEQVKRAVGGGD